MSNTCGKMSWRPLEKFGAEVSFDLRETMTAEEQDCFVQLFDEYDLLMFRHQTLSLPQQTRILELIGPITKAPAAHSILSNEVASDIAQTAELTFHSDYAWAPRPLTSISLHAVDVIDGASATKFANSRRALEKLPPRMRARLEGLDADMVAPLPTTLSSAGKDMDSAAFPVHERRPAVNINERTGRPFILVNQMLTSTLLDLPGNEGKSFLQEVLDHIYVADNILEHRWHRGDFVVWDNRNVQHARADVTSVGRRVLQRVSVGSSLAEQYPGINRASDYVGQAAAGR